MTEDDDAQGLPQVESGLPGRKWPDWQGGCISTPIYVWGVTRFVSQHRIHDLVVMEAIFNDGSIAKTEISQLNELRRIVP